MASKDLDPFTKACELDSITALLSPIDDLGQYSGSFIAAQIDTELATRMTMQDLRVLLPDAPLGHCLRIHSESWEVLDRRGHPHSRPAGCFSGGYG